jgi:hypothetical protein
MYLDYREAWKVSTEEDLMPEYLNATAGLKQSAEKPIVETRLAASPFARP